jgi:hypothetical protein
VAGPGDEIGAERGNVNGHVRNRLAGIDDADRPDRLGLVHHEPDRVDGAKDVGLVDQGDDLRRAVDDPIEVIEVQATVVGQADPLKRRAGLRTQFLPRDEVGMMLHLGDDDCVARRQHETGIDTPRRVGRQRGCVGERVRGEVQALGRVLREDEIVGLGGDEARHVGSRVLVRVRGLLGQLVRTAMNSGVAGLVEGSLGVEDDRWLLTRRTAVEIDQWPSVAHGSLQDREVLPDPGDVEGVGHD